MIGLKAKTPPTGTQPPVVAKTECGAAQPALINDERILLHRAKNATHEFSPREPECLFEMDTLNAT
jgi:hypothetical protein